jgi:hypothetical protein
VPDVAVTLSLLSGGNVIPGEELVFLGQGDGTFQAVITSAGPDYPSYAAAGDFNGDGKLDLMVEAYTDTALSSVSAFLLLGNGDGTFQAPTAALPAFASDNSAGPMIAADVNKDGKLDLIVTNGGGTQIFLGDGEGAFSNTNSYLGSSYLGPAVADFNLDGNLDIASGNILLGNGNGTFQGIQDVLLPITAVMGPTSTVTGDFESNGKVDVATLAQPETQSGTTLYILSNNGAGQLSLIHTYTLLQTAGQIVAGDVNGDGKLDLLTTAQDISSGNWGYILLLGNGDGSFQSPVFVSEGSGSASSIVVADFNNDKKLDLAIEAGTQSVAILLGNGDGTFAAPVYYFNAGFSPLVVADYNGDGKLDIASGGEVPLGGASETAILYGNGDGTFQAAVFPASLNNFAPVFTGDVNNDGKPDLMSLFQVALGNGDGTFTLLPPSSKGPYFGEFADFNGDGRLDVLAYTTGPTGLLQNTGVMLGNGDGTFGPLITISTSGLIDQDGLFPFSLPVVDMNGDGKPDIVFPYGPDGDGPEAIAVLLNTTGAGFTLSATAPLPGPVTAGNSATSTVTVAPTFEFNQTVTLSCAGLPTGASCGFVPPSVAGSSGMSTLTITTTASLAAGTYPAQVQGTAGTVTNSASISLAVQAAPDFSVGAASGSPTSQTVSAGQGASFSLALAPTGSFTGTVNLSCAITPAVNPAPTCALSSSSVQFSGSETQSVTVSVGTMAASSSGALPRVTFPPGPRPLMWTLMLLAATWLWLRSRKRLPVLASAVVVAAFAFLVGCGGSSSSTHTTTPGTPAGTYTATVTATSGSLSHNTALEVIVQ